MYIHMHLHVNGHVECSGAHHQMLSAVLEQTLVVLSFIFLNMPHCMYDKGHNNIVCTI